MELVDRMLPVGLVSESPDLGAIQIICDTFLAFF
jgi:hypothetical protein